MSEVDEDDDAVIGEPDDAPFQFTLRTLFLATTLIAFLLGLGIWLDAPLLFPTVAILLLAGCAWRGTRSSRGGILVATAGAEVVVVGGYGVFCAQNDIDFFIMALFAFLGALLVLGGGIVFLARAQRRDSARWQNAFCCAASFLAPVVWFLVGLPMANHALQARIARRNAENATAMAKIVGDVNALCARLQRVPESEGELTMLLGRSMPGLRGGYSSSRIHYLRMGSNHYRLWFTNANWNISVYDSQTPKRGWYEEIF